MRAIEATLDRGRNVLMLVPEIGLTPAMAGQFFHRFGDQVAILHSAFNESERAEQWRRIQAGKARVVVGTQVRRVRARAEAGTGDRRRRARLNRAISSRRRRATMAATSPSCELVIRRRQSYSVRRRRAWKATGMRRRRAMACCGCPSAWPSGLLPTVEVVGHADRAFSRRANSGRFRGSCSKKSANGFETGNR